MQPKKSALKKSQPKEQAAAATATTAPAASSNAGYPGAVIEEEVSKAFECLV